MAVGIFILLLHAPQTSNGVCGFWFWLMGSIIILFNSTLQFKFHVYVHTVDCVVMSFFSPDILASARVVFSMEGIGHMLIDRQQSLGRSEEHTKWNNKEKKKKKKLILVALSTWTFHTALGSSKAGWILQLFACFIGESKKNPVATIAAFSLSIPSWFIVNACGTLSHIRSLVTMNFQGSRKLMETLVHERPWKLTRMKTVLPQQLQHCTRINYFYEWLTADLWTPYGLC